MLKRVSSFRILETKMGAWGEREGVLEVYFITDAPQSRNAQESVESNLSYGMVFPWSCLVAKPPP